MMFFKAYLASHFGKSLMWHASNIAFAFFLTEICHLPTVLMAWTLAGSSVANALADGVIGRSLARRMRDIADASRHQLVGAIAAGCSFAVFCGSGLIAEPARAGFALTTLVVFRIAYGFVDVPQNALLSYLPVDARQQERLVAVRLMMGYTAQMAAALLLSGLILRHSRLDSVYFVLGGSAIGAVAVGTAAVFALACGTPTAAPGQAPVPRGTSRSETPFLHLLIASAVVAFVSTLVLRLQPYLAVYDSGSSATALVPVAMALGGMIGQPIWAMLCRRQGAAATLRVASAALIGSALLLGASGRGGGVAMLLDTGLFGVAFGGTSFGLWTLLARSGRGNPALRMGIFTCTSKLAHAASALALGAVLVGSDSQGWFAKVSALWASSTIAAVAMGLALLLIASAPRRQRRGV